MSLNEQYIVEILLQANTDLDALEQAGYIMRDLSNNTVTINTDMDQLASTSDVLTTALDTTVESIRTQNLVITEAERGFIANKITLSELLTVYGDYEINVATATSRVKELISEQERLSMSMSRAVDFFQQGINIFMQVERGLMRMDIASMRVETANWRLEASQERTNTSLENYNEQLAKVSDLQQDLTDYISTENTRIGENTALMWSAREARMDGLNTLATQIAGEERYIVTGQQVSGILYDMNLVERVLSTTRDTMSSSAIEKILTLEQQLMTARDEMITASFSVEEAELRLEGAEIRVTEATLAADKAQTLLTAAIYAYGEGSDAVIPYQVAYDKALLDLETSSLNVEKAQYSLVKANEDYAVAVTASDQSSATLNTTLIDVESTGNILTSTDEKLLDMQKKLDEETDIASDRNTAYEQALRQVEIQANFVEQANSRMSLAYLALGGVLLTSGLDFIQLTGKMGESLAAGGDLNKIIETLSGFTLPGLGAGLLPIIAVIGVVAYVVAGLYAHWDELVAFWDTWVTPGIKTVTDAFGNLGAALGITVDWMDVLKFVTEPVKLLFEGFMIVLRGILEIIAALVNGIAAVINFFKGLFTQTEENIEAQEELNEAVDAYTYGESPGGVLDAIAATKELQSSWSDLNIPDVGIMRATGASTGGITIGNLNITLSGAEATPERAREFASELVSELQRFY